MQDNQKLINIFLETKKGCSPSTQRHYSSRLDVFAKYLSKNKIDLKKLTQDNLIDFFSKHYSKFKPKTMNHIKAVLVAFIKYQFPKDYISKFPNLSNICRSQKVIPKYDASQMLSLEEVQKLIQEENNPTWKLIFAMQFYGGCRPIEICRLKWKDITIADDGVYFSVYSAKNNRKFEKFVPLEFSNYMKELQKKAKSEYCFNDENKPLSRNVVYNHLIRLSKKVFPDKHINPYLLRHSIATILYGRAEKGELSSDVVARQMGHTKNMKDFYAHFDLKTLRDNAKKIYIKPDYTPEQKKELETRIKELETQQRILLEFQKKVLEFQKSLENQEWEYVTRKKK